MEDARRLDQQMLWSILEQLDDMRDSSAVTDSAAFEAAVKSLAVATGLSLDDSEQRRQLQLISKK